MRLILFPDDICGRQRRINVERGHLLVFLLNSVRVQNSCSRTFNGHIAN